MARIRSLKPEAFQSETLAEVSLAAERTFFGLSTQVDDRGRIADKPAVINGAIWAVRAERELHTAKDLEAELEELVAEGAVCRYVGCDGKRYLHLVTFDDHQKVDRPSKSRLPRCPEHGREDYCGKHEGECLPSESASNTRDASANARDGLASDSRALDAGSRTLDRGSGIKEPSSSATASADDDEGDEEPDASEDATAGQKNTGQADLSPDLVAAIDRICEHLAQRVVANGSRPPTVGKKWRDAARLMMTADGRTERQVHNMIDWCQSDGFWRSHILSLPKLRDKYDTMRLQIPGASSSSKAPPSKGHGDSGPFLPPQDYSNVRI